MNHAASAQGALPTFRDPSGSLSFAEDHAIRSIHPAARDEVFAFLRSGLCARLQHRGDMVAISVEEDPGGMRLIHPLIPTPAFPWEWTPSQWLAAAELTLRLCEEAVAEGWILKDATPLNILFLGTRPVLVDVLSFAPRQPGSAIWLAYGQYVRTFLLPLLANHLMGWPMALTILRRDGYEPAELYAHMGWLTRLSPSALWPVSLPAWLDRRESAAGSQAGPPARPMADDAAVHILKRTLGGLRRRTRHAVSRPPVSEWSEYRKSLKHYSEAESRHKREWVQSVLERLHPRCVLDVGANTGEFSFLAASRGIDVVALERDAGAAEQLFRVAEASALPVLVLQADFARPTPAVGWDNRESSALLPRLERRFDLVLLLAVIHHLLLLEQIPLRNILKLCHRITSSTLVLEWVPVTDPMFQSLMRGRDNLYGSLCEDDLLAAADGLFSVDGREPLENGRVLFLFTALEDHPA